MSTLKLSTISNPEGTSTAAVNAVISGYAKAWVQYNAVTQVILASYNVSSVTYVSTGQFTVNFTNAFADTNYAVTGCAGGATAAVIDVSASILNIKNNSADSVSTGFLRVKTGYSDTTVVNYPYTSVACFR